MDTTRPLIHEHCKKLLVNLLMLYATHGDHFAVAKLAISSRNVNEPSCLNLVPPTNTASARHTGKQLVMTEIVHIHRVGEREFLSVAAAVLRLWTPNDVQIETSCARVCVCRGEWTS